MGRGAAGVAGLSRAIWPERASTAAAAAAEAEAGAAAAEAAQVAGGRQGAHCSSERKSAPIRGEEDRAGGGPSTSMSAGSTSALIGGTCPRREALETYLTHETHGTAVQILVGTSRDRGPIGNRDTIRSAFEIYEVAHQSNDRNSRRKL